MKTANRPKNWSAWIARYRLLLMVIVGLLLTYGLLSLAAGQYFGAGGNESGSGQAVAFRNWLLAYGDLAPIVFIALQTLQVLLAPIPGQLTALVGGYAFGWKAGLLYSMIGLAIGSLAAMVLARRFGRPLVLALHAEKAVQDVESLLSGGKRSAKSTWLRVPDWLQSRGELAFFAIMLLPALPDDVACFAAGMTRIPIWRLMAAALLGRLPGMLVLSMLGDGESTWTVRIALIAVVVIACVCSYLLFRRPASPTTIAPAPSRQA